MPEGDTVWRAAHAMHQALAGRALTGCDVRVPAHATADLSSWTVDQVVSRGKHLLHRFRGPSGAGVSLHSHLKMEGSWHLYRRGSHWRRPVHEARVVLTTEDWQAVGFALGICELLDTAAEERVVGHLGPDLLGPDWDAEEAVRRMRSDPTRTVAEALIDQRNLAGIGTIYRSETLFLRGIGPRARVAEVADLNGVVSLARRLMLTNRERALQVTTGDARTGRQLWVHGRAGQSCRRCGTRIRRDELGPAGKERGIFWCPRCQPEPA